MIRLQLLGGVEITSDEVSCRRALLHEPCRLAVLILAAAWDGAFLPRSRICSILWPELDREKSRNCLRQAIHRVRTLLGSDVLLTHGNGDVEINTSVVDVDVRRFRCALRGFRYEEALDLYRGPFLEGLELRGRPEFDDWADAVRVQLARSAHAAATCLAKRSEEQKRLTDAATWWERAVEIDQHDEMSLRGWMRSLALSGSRGQAIAAYRRGQRRLVDSFGIELSRETRALAEHIASDSP